MHTWTFSVVSYTGEDEAGPLHATSKYRPFPSSPRRGSCYRTISFRPLPLPVTVITEHFRQHSSVSIPFLHNTILPLGILGGEISRDVAAITTAYIVAPFPPSPLR